METDSFCGKILLFSLSNLKNKMEENKMERVKRKIKTKKEFSANQ